MQPAPAPKKGEVEEKIDDAIARIDAALPVLHRKIEQAREDNGPSLTPSPEACQQTFQRTQQALTKLVKEMQDSDTWDVAQFREERRKQREQSRKLKKA